MTGTPNVVGSIPPEAAAASAQRTPKKKDAKAKSKPVPAAAEKPTHALPTDRVGLAKQFELLRAWAALVQQGTAAPSNLAIANLVDLNRATTLLAIPYFIDIGFLTKVGDGYAPAPEVVAYGKAFSWNQETAAQRLASVLQRSWAAQVVLPHLRMGPQSETRIVQLLGEACSAGPKFEGQLKLLLQYLVLTGVVRRDGDTIREGAATADAGVEMQPRTESDTTAPKVDAAPSVRDVRVPGINTAFAQVPEGVLRFNVDVNVDLREFAAWTPERISAFWSGIAQVLAAKAAVEAGGKA